MTMMMMMRRTMTQNPTKMSLRSSENPTNNRIPGGSLLPDTVQTMRSPLDIAAARREVDDRVFGRDRLQEAALHLGTRLTEVKKSEERIG
jgi:hypothetical protein